MSSSDYQPDLVDRPRLVVASKADTVVDADDLLAPPRWTWPSRR